MGWRNSRHAAPHSELPPGCRRPSGAAAADVQLTQALRQTQLEHSKTLEAHTRTLTEHGKLLGALVSGQVAMLKQLGAITEQLGIESPASPQE